MKNSAEKNEIAGRAEKKLPRDTESRDLTAANSSSNVAKATSESAPVKKEAFDPNPVSEIAAKASSVSTPVPTAASPEKSAPSSAVQVEHIARLVSNEVTTLRQSGANVLAVSLKVDSHTELFVQLSNHGGQTQASIRFERGSLDGLGAHWNDLQQSLARQNVQLLPPVAGNPASGQGSRFNADSNGAVNSDSSNSQQSTGNFRRQANDSQEPALTGNNLANVPKQKQKSGATALKGWESWA